MGEAAALLVLEPEGDGTLAVDYEVAPDCLRIDLRLTGLSGDGQAAGRPCPRWRPRCWTRAWTSELLDGGGAFVLVKRLSELDDGDGDEY